MTTPTQMPESLKAVAWRDDGLSASNGTDGPDYRVVTEKTKQSMPHAAVVAYTDALVLLADAQSALKDRDAEIERLKKDAERWDFVRHHWSNVQMRWNNDETNSLKSITLTVKTAHWSCDADAIESQIDAAIDSMKGDANG